MAGPPVLVVTGDHLAGWVLQYFLRLRSILLGLPELLALFLYLHATLKSRLRQEGARQELH